MRRIRIGPARAAASLYLFGVVCFAIFAFADPADAQGPSTERTGMWKATVGDGPVMQGMWLAEISEGSQNAARGSWSLLNDSGEVVLQGTWSARKTSPGWEGSWSARAGNGRALSGTWSASLGEFKGKTLHEMLALTVEKQIGGGWHSGRYQGNWWLERSGKRAPKSAGGRTN